MIRERPELYVKALTEAQNGLRYLKLGRLIDSFL